MPPQLVSRIKPNITYSIHPGNFDERPRVAQAIAECINAWSRVESAMGWLFICLLKTNEARGAELYATFDSDKARRDSLTALATSSLNGKDFQIVSALMRYIKSQHKIRNKIAHWVWGVSPELEDSMILIDPKEQIYGVGYITLFVKNLANKTLQHFFENEHQNFKQANVYSYSRTDLQKDRDVFISLQEMIRDVAVLCLTGYLSTEQHDEIYTKLVRDARLVEYLIHSLPEDQQSR